MNVLDLSQDFSVHTPAFASYDGPSVKWVKRLAFDKAGGQEITSTLHVGTHLDAPAHFYSGGKFIGDLPLDWLVGPACVVDLERMGLGDFDLYGPEHFERWEQETGIAIERGDMPPERVFVVRSGPNLARVKRLPPDPEWSKGRTFLVGYVGVISRAEGLDLLLASVKHTVYALGRRDIHFAIAGSGPELEAIKEMAEDMEVADYVTFTGRIDDEKLLTMLSTADVCVNPDRVTAMNDISTMNKIMEYMALGKPIVQFDVKEGRFSAQDASLYAKANDTVDFAEKVLALIDNPERRAFMGDYGRKRVEEALAWHHEQPKLLNAYAKVAEIRGRRWKFLNPVRRLFSGSRDAWQQQL